MRLPDIEDLIRYPGAPQAGVILLALAGLCFISWIRPEAAAEPTMSASIIEPCGPDNMPPPPQEHVWQWPLAETLATTAAAIVAEKVASSEEDEPRRRHHRRHRRH